jgi:hypothetical protein
MNTISESAHAILIFMASVTTIIAPPCCVSCSAAMRALEALYDPQLRGQGDNLMRIMGQLELNVQLECNYCPFMRQPRNLKLPGYGT